MRTILNVALGVALAFCIISILSGSIEKQINEAVETAVATHLGQIESANPTQPNVDVNAAVEKVVTKAVAKVKEERKVTTKTVTQVPVETPKAATAKPADNRVWIDVRGPKGAVKLYVGQPKAEVLDLLGTPDSFDFGGTSENCRYRVNGDYYWIHFRNGKLTSVDKY